MTTGQRRTNTPPYAARRQRNAGARKLFKLGLLARDSDSEDRRRDAFVNDFKFDSDCAQVQLEISVMTGEPPEWSHNGVIYDALEDSDVTRSQSQNRRRDCGSPANLNSKSES